jgi:hypothetical protein
MVLTPLMFIIFLLIFWGFYIVVKKKDRKVFADKMITSLVITIFSLQPSISNALISIISCRQILDKYYIRSDLNEECRTENHMFYVNFLFFPFFSLYAGIFPLLAFAYMYYYRNSLTQISHIKKIGFLTNGYLKNKFYW